MISRVAFDLEALEWCARRLDPSLALQEAWSPPDWIEGARAIEQAFALDRPAHFLRHHRGLLPRLWERQVTEALRAMLLEEPHRTLERCRALLRATEGDMAAAGLAHVDRVTADERDRIDLAIHGRDAEGTPTCIAIEAKLDSGLGETQLLRYLERLRVRYPRCEQRHLWVVAPEMTSKTARIMARRENAEWRFITWRHLILSWQRALPDEPGSDVLSLFGEIWKRVGGS